MQQKIYSRKYAADALRHRRILTQDVTKPQGMFVY